MRYKSETHRCHSSDSSIRWCPSLKVTFSGRRFALCLCAWAHVCNVHVCMCACVHVCVRVRAQAYRLSGSTRNTTKFHIQAPGDRHKPWTPRYEVSFLLISLSVSLSVSLARSLARLLALQTQPFGGTHVRCLRSAELAHVSLERYVSLNQHIL